MKSGIKIRSSSESDNNIKPRLMQCRFEGKRLIVYMYGFNIKQNRGSGRVLSATSKQYPFFTNANDWSLNNFKEFNDKLILSND